MTKGESLTPVPFFEATGHRVAASSTGRALRATGTECIFSSRKAQPKALKMAVLQIKNHLLFYDCPRV